MTKCWTCRRRRLKCDEQLPICSRCDRDDVVCHLEKPLKWINHSQNNATISALTLQRRSHAEAVVARNSGGRRICPTPIDPHLKDLSRDVRFFMHYFEERVCPALILCDSSRNPFKSVISLIQSSQAVQSAIMAISTCHYAHGSTGSPVCSPNRGKKQKQIGNGSVVVSFFFWKHRALSLLAKAVQSIDVRQDVSTLVAAILLLVLELWESGAQSWTVHLEGVKSLLSSTDGLDQMKLFGLENVVDSLISFEAFGASLASPQSSLASSRLSLVRNPQIETPELSIVGCPYQVLLAIDVVSSKRQLAADNDLADSNLIELRQQLDIIQHFDVLDWTLKMAQSQSDFASSISQPSLLHMCDIWTLAAEIYTLRVIYTLTHENALIERLTGAVAEIVSKISLISHHDELIKCLIWPTFIAGTECIDARHKQAILTFLDCQWRITLGANAKDAAAVLTDLWEKRARIEADATTIGKENQSWDWLHEIWNAGNNWLFF